MKLVERKKYIEYLDKVKNTPDIKVVTGIRRSGKSELLKSFMEKLKIENPKANFISIDLPSIEYENLLDYHNLNNYIEGNHKKNVKNYLFIDEIQNCHNFERTINSLHSKKLFDMYLTGSNAFLLSSDLVTFFTGRTMEVSIFPFSFNEFMQYFEYSDLQEGFNKYIEIGGFAGSYYYNDKKTINDYVNNVFNNLIDRDIIKKFGIRDHKLTKNLATFLADNISNLTSSRKIANILSTKDFNENHNTISKYINYLCNSFMFYEMKRFDLKGKQILNTTEKYYLADHSLKYALLTNSQKETNFFQSQQDYGNLLENIIAIELLRRGYKTHVGKLYQKEIDFVASDYLGNRFYIQVGANIDNNETFKREITPLLQIKDNYPKIILSRTKFQQEIVDGVKVIDIAQWLNYEIDF